MKMALLFSSPRSGSTLLANIIRSHPAVEFYNEVFTRAPYLLPNFEHAFQNQGSDLRKVFEEDFRKLRRYKLRYRNNILHGSRFRKFFIFFLIKVGASISTRVPIVNMQWNFFHKSYHINSLHEPPVRPFWITQFVKEPYPAILFFKDVRIRKAFYAFAEMYPDAYFIYLIRNPYFVIASTLTQRRITDISSMKIDPDYLRKSFRRPELVDRFFGKTIEQTFAIQWILENEMVIEDLKKCDSGKIKIIRFELLIPDAESITKELFKFLGLDLSIETSNYLISLQKYSGQQRHNRSTFVGSNWQEKLSRPRLSKSQLKNISSVLEQSDLGSKYLSTDLMPSI